MIIDELSTCNIDRSWLNSKFHRAKEINISDVLKHKHLSGDYSKGGFYLIKTDAGSYIGKSMDYLNRLKQHIYKSSHRTDIDRVLNSITEYKLYLILDYKSVGINFFNRRLETIIEQTFIAIALNEKHKLLNKTVYGHLQII